MATQHLKTMDITGIPDLLRIAEEVRDTNEPRLLKRDNEEVAVLIPARSRARVKRVPTKADHEAFLAAAGSWKDLDVDRFIADNEESRKRSSGPPVEL